MAIELQTCKGDLQNTRILADESARLADSASAAVLRLSAQRTALTRAPKEAPASNEVYAVLFEFGSTQVALPEATAARLVDQARTSPLVMLRGRTDGSVETPVESRIARERAAAVKAYLVKAGVDPSHIRTTWQPVGDFAADNGTSTGRNLNRRVEVEVYRIAPHNAAPGDERSS
jgi:outer membrane protein OmpA-like peptidoglycan-associated protein